MMQLTNVMALLIYAGHWFVFVGCMAQWLGRRSLAGGVSLIYA